MKWTEYKIHTTTANAEPIGELLYELGIQGFEISDHVPLTPEEERQMFTDIPKQMQPDDGKATITFYTEAEEGDKELTLHSTGSSLRDEALPKQEAITDPQALIHRLQEEIHQFLPETDSKMPVIEYHIVDDSDWKDKWKENYTAFRVTDHMIVKPLWEDIPDFAEPEDILIDINPGSAFGTGTHETTKLCMLALTGSAHKNARILDVGCGSGILAICALLSGAGRAFCLDIDPLAVEGTLENAGLNHIPTDRITALQANILEEADELPENFQQPFDIVVANILADIIIPLSGIIGRFLKEDGIFISSGILIEKADEVKSALHKNGFTVLHEDQMGEWTAITARLAP